MIIDARSVPENELIEAELCIIGAGVTGLSLALEFLDSDLRVCLLESGGGEPDKLTQSLYWGENLGHPYYPLDHHGARCLGGTAHRWHAELADGRFGVRLRPLDPIDFEQRDWIPHSGWPFGRQHLDPYYERAHRVCQLGPYDYRVGTWSQGGTSSQGGACEPLPFRNGQVGTTIFQFGPRDPFLSEYQTRVGRAGNITTYLYANAIGLETGDSLRQVQRVRVACLSGNRFSVAARYYVLATNGIETPRLLLLSNDRQPEGLGNQHDLVGRFFMEHPHLWAGFFVPADPAVFDRVALYRMRLVGGTSVMAKLALDEHVLRRDGLLNYCVSLHPSGLPGRLSYPGPSSASVESFKTLRASLRRGRLPDKPGRHLRNILTGVDELAARGLQTLGTNLQRNRQRFKPPQPAVFSLNHMSEQVPNPDSRVTLGHETDLLGLRRAQLNWKLSSLDLYTIVRAQELIDQALRQADLGYLHIESKQEAMVLRGIHGGYHQMGTTRINADARKGVVNADLRVHGVGNLFITGPSVFPTVGYANPVLTSVALTLRLADHLRSLT